MKKNIDVDFRRQCIEDVMRLNNAGALFYIMKRSGLKECDFVPGTQKTYMQRAIEFGATSVVEKLLEQRVDSKENLNLDSAYWDCLLHEEKRALGEDENVLEDKITKLLVIASSLLKAGVGVSKDLGSKLKAKNSTPVINLLKEYYSNVKTA